MADQDWPNQNANKSKAEGERWSSEQSGVRNDDLDEVPAREYPGDDGDDAGGITNRPYSEEVDNQERLPERGTYKDQTANPASRRPEGDYQEDEQ